MTKITTDVSCADDYDPNSIDCDVAQQRILDAVEPVAGDEKTAIRSTLGRILASDIKSTINVPAHTNSAMDGYALHGTVLPTDSTLNLTQVGISYAGKPYTGKVENNQCVRIMTGAVMPDQADTVVMQEHVEKLDDQTIKIGTGHQTGQNVRQAGEDLEIGQTVLKAGKRITPADLGLIASLGIAEIKIKRKLRVAFFSTGDELCSIGNVPKLGEIYDSNRYTLFAMLSRLNVEMIDMGVVRDTKEEVETAFSTASKIADVVISSGGVSVGDADYITETLERSGQVNFWKVAMKPGRPLTFGKLGEAVFFGLPGNPVSVMVTFYQFVQPALRRIMGESSTRPLTLKARCTTKLRKRPGRTEFQRGVMETGEDGELLVHVTGEQGSGILRSMSEANCFIVLPKESSGIEADNTVDVQPFAGLV